MNYLTIKHIKMKTPLEILNEIIEMQDVNYGNGMNTHMALHRLCKEAREIVKNLPVTHSSLLLKENKRPIFEVWKKENCIKKDKYYQYRFEERLYTEKEIYDRYRLIPD